MKKILVAALAMAMAFTSCVKDEPAPKAPEAPNYAALRLNEINGTPSKADKYVEIYNTSDKAVSLDGVQFFYNGKPSWTGSASDVVPAKGFFCLTGTKGSGMMTLGLSDDSNIRVELKDPTGKVLDFFQRGTGLNDTVLEAGHSFSRVPDGTGEWYYTAPEGTKGATNGTSTEGLTQVETDGLPQAPDYTKLVLNEINGTAELDNDKYIELYNGGKAELSLENFTIYYGADVTWTGTAESKIAAGGYLVLKGSKGTGDLIKGLTAKGNTRIELKDAEGNLLDFFQRGDGSGAKLSGVDALCYSRMPNGTGAWYYTDPAGTEGKDNGSSVEGLTLVESDVPNEPRK